MRALYDQVNGLSGLGHEIEVWCPPQPADPLVDLRDLVPCHEVPLREGPSQLRDHVPCGVALFELADPKRMDRHSRVVAREMGAGRFDLAFVGTCRLYGSPRLGRWLDLPSVLYLQEPHRPLYEVPVDFSGKPTDVTGDSLLVDILRSTRQRRAVRAERINAMCYSRILANSRYSIEVLERVYGLSTTFSPLGVDTSKWRIEKSRPERMVLGLGEIRPHKRADFIFRAAARVRPVPRVEWIGNSVDASYLSFLKRIAGELGVEFVPHEGLSHEEMLDVLASAWCLAYAPRLEPFGYAPLECAAAGVPTVAVAEGGIRETVIHGETGLLVDRNVEAMGTQLQRIFDDVDLRGRLADRARATVESKWSLSRAMLQLQQELHSVIR